MPTSPRKNPVVRFDTGYPHKKNESKKQGETMKLSGLARVIKDHMICNVFRIADSNEFYIGAGAGIYSMTGFPFPCCRDETAAMLGISDNTMEKIAYDEYEVAYKEALLGFDLRDAISEEEEVKELGIEIVSCGENLIPLVEEKRQTVGMIGKSTLVPIMAEINGNGYIKYYKRRRASGSEYYVVKNGMCVIAAIEPYRLSWTDECRLQSLVAMLAETNTEEMA